MGSCVVLVVTREEATVVINREEATVTVRQECCAQHAFYYQGDACSVPDLWGRSLGTKRIQAGETLDEDRDKEGCGFNYVAFLKKEKQGGLRWVCLKETNFKNRDK